MSRDVDDISPRLTRVGKIRRGIVLGALEYGEERTDQAQSRVSRLRTTLSFILPSLPIISGIACMSLSNLRLPMAISDGKIQEQHDYVNVFAPFEPLKASDARKAPTLHHAALTFWADQEIILHLHRLWRAKFRDLEATAFTEEFGQSMPQFHEGQVNAQTYPCTSSKRCIGILL